MELWDIYDENGNPTGRTHERGQPLSPGDYHLAVTITVVRLKRVRPTRVRHGEIEKLIEGTLYPQVLCTQRSMDKPLMPGAWESPGGGVLAGETSLEAAVRELQEETGIAAAPGELQFLSRRRADDFFMDVYGLRRDVPLAKLSLQPHEVDDARWISLDEWERRTKAGEILAGDYTDEFFAAVRALAAPE